MSNNLNTFMIKQQIKKMLNQVKNIEMKINIKNGKVMENKMMIQIPNLMNKFENNNPMGTIKKNFNENISLEDKKTIKYNVTFLQETGIKTILVLDKETKIKEMIELYLNKIGMEVEDIKYKKFIYNGANLDMNSKQSIEELFGPSIAPCIYPTF